MANDFDLQLRVIETGRIIRAESIDFTTPHSAPATLSFSATRAATATLTLPLEVAVETWDGTDWLEYEDARFMATKLRTDELDPAEVQDATSVAWAFWHLSKGVHQWASEEPRVINMGAGELMGNLLTDEQENGWAPDLNWTFTDTHDSNGAPWTAASHVEMEYQGGETLRAILEGLEAAGAFTVSTRGRELILLNPGSRTDRTDEDGGRVTLGGTATAMPTETSVDELATHVYVRGDKGRHWTFPVPGADATGGKLFTYLDAAGVTTRAQAEKLAAMPKRAAQRPRASYTLTEPGSTMTHRPWRNFSTGDLVLARSGSSWKKLTVAEIQVRRGATGACDVDITLGDRVKDELVSLLTANRSVTGTIRATKMPTVTPPEGIFPGGTEPKIMIAKNPAGHAGAVYVEGMDYAIGTLGGYVPYPGEKVAVAYFNGKPLAMGSAIFPSPQWRVAMVNRYGMSSATTGDVGDGINGINLLMGEFTQGDSTTYFFECTKAGKYKFDLRTASNLADTTKIEGSYSQLTQGLSVNSLVPESNGSGMTWGENGAISVPGSKHHTTIKDPAAGDHFLQTAGELELVVGDKVQAVFYTPFSVQQAVMPSGHLGLAIWPAADPWGQAIDTIPPSILNEPPV